MTWFHVRGRAAAAILVIAVATGACGGPDSSSQATAPAGEAAPPFGQADVDFVVRLSQHHGQALHLAELAASRASSPAVKAVAGEIAAAYAPQVDTLADWIRSWAEAGAELPAHEVSHGEAGPGMLSERAVNRLESLEGRAFNRQFRVLMSRHHRSGLALVNDQLAGGVNPEALALAERLRTAQTNQLAQLN